jgi:hypothetical protein
MAFQFNESKVYTQLYLAIKADKNPTSILYTFLASQTIEGNVVANQIVQNRSIVKLLTSPEGKRWLHKHLDATLDYIAQVAGV